MEKINILITEDEPIIAADLADRLTDAGFHVMDCLASGEETLAFLEKETPELLLMDIRLEGELDGIQTVEKIKQLYDLPIIFLTSNTDEDTFLRAKKTKPHAFIGKPFRGRDLMHSIELAVSTFSREKNGTPPDADEEDVNSYLLEDRIFIREKNNLIRLFFKDILWIEADGYYCKVKTATRSYLVTMTLKKLIDANTLPDWLMRVHRSYVINVKHIESIGEIYLHIQGEKIPLGKGSREDLKRHLRVL